ncbi:MAG: NYN domain-containing protein [Promethearchaeota archaeon]
MYTERIMIFIDNSNIFKGFIKYNIRADYDKLKEVISRGRNLIEIRLYEGVVYPLASKKKKWYKDLKNISGYKVKTSFDKWTNDLAIEKKIDVKLAIDVIAKAYEDAFDTAVILSGDGDFLPMIKKVIKLGKNVEIWAFKYSLANTIERIIPEDKITYLENILNKIKID